MFFNFKRKKYHLPYFCTAIVKHCNLNCKYCDHFSPLAKEEYKSANELEKHFTRLNELLSVDKIGLMGGEPLLHPDIVNIIEITRKSLPNTEILIVTNGILLDKMPDEFWEICKKYDVGILISKFNIDINKKEIINKKYKYMIRANYYGAKRGEYKTMYKTVLDLSGKQNKEEMYKLCFQNKGVCNYFEDGKLYQCCIAGNISSFNEFFNKNLELTENDYIDIYKVKSYKQIEEYFNRTIDFCRYCNIPAQKSNLAWEVSKREISDWTM